MTSSMLSDFGAYAGPPRVQVPPPPNFRPIVGKPREVNLHHGAVYVRKRGSTVARHAGLLYEARVQTALFALFPLYVMEPQLEFLDDSGYRTVRPDGVLITPDRVVVFEIKLQHMPEAWWQLRNLYGPILAAGTKRPAQLVEVVRTYDPATPFPEQPHLIPDLRSWVLNTAAIPHFGVSVCRL